MRSWNGPTRPWIIEHVNGVPWHEAPPPPRRHRHEAQTTGTPGTGLRLVERCACGAIREWDERGTLGWALDGTPRVAPRRTIRQLFKRK